MKFSVFQASRQGGRENNEDRAGYRYTHRSGLFLLADGMGAHPQGEVAAQIAVHTLLDLFQRQARPVLRDIAGFLSTALLEAHHEIVHYARKHRMTEAPRTTLVAVVVQGNAATWVHCGDSRLYLVREGALVTRTRDHSYVEYGTALGGAGLEQVSRNVLFTCLGSPVRPMFDVAAPVAMHTGDKLLLCSDGLWANLSDAGIVRELDRAPVDQAVPDLVGQALANGGPHCDSVTALAFEWEAPDAASPGRQQAFRSSADTVFSPTLQSDLPDGTDALDDEAIDRSIAEINETIRRSGIRNL